jgi:hypothetical protein
MQAVQAGSIEKVFWFSTFAWAGLNVPDSNQFGMYSEDGWSVRRAGQVSALRHHARATAFDQRFTPSADAPVLFDLAALAPTASWTTIAAADTNVVTFGTARAHAFAGATEDGVTAVGLAATLDDTVDYVVGTFMDLAVPAVGRPTLRLSMGYATATPAVAQTVFEVWLIGGEWPDHETLFTYDKAKNGALETAELDLYQVRGTVIYVVLRAHRTGTLGVGQSAEVVWVAPRIIDRAL